MYGQKTKTFRKKQKNKKTTTNGQYKVTRELIESSFSINFGHNFIKYCPIVISQVLPNDVC